MLEFLKKLFKRKPEFFPGVLDERIKGNNVHDFREGVALGAVAKFTTKKLTELRKFPYQYQDGSSACVAFTMAKIACVLYWLATGRSIKFSPAFYYTRRLNKPDKGMYFSDISALASEGSCLYDLLPSEGLSEDQINSVKIEQYHKDSADAFAIPIDWLELTDFDTVAATIEKTGKPVMLWFRFGPGEWFGKIKPRILGDDKRWAHSVCAVDAFTDVRDGRQYLKIEDSAEPEEYYCKYIDREFFSRCYLRRYPISFKWVKDKTIPVYAGTIQSMQDVLRALGYFPNNQNSTGYFGSITLKAVREFCIINNIQFKNQYSIWPELDMFLKQKYA